MEHGAPTQWREEKSGNFKTRLGIIMFAIFCPIYVAFILICVLSPTTMKVDVGSLNLAIAYGFGIIIFAIILAVIYDNICGRREKRDGDTTDSKGGKA